MRKFLFLLAVTLIVPLGLFYQAPTASATQCSSQIAGKSRAQLEAELEACNAEIAQWTATLNQTKEQSASFARDVSALTAKINAAQANIRGKNIAINNISRDISSKQSQILTLDQKITESKRAIADILRKTNEINSYSLVEALLSNKDFSEFFVDVDTYASTGRALDTLLTQLNSTRKLTEAEREELNRKKNAEAAARAALEASKKEVELSQAEKQRLLAISKNQERTYAQEVAERQAKAAQIRATLFPLPASGPIPFSTALQHAQAASAKTGVRAAFILGIFATESGKGSDGTFGRNVGQCLLTNSPNKGDGKGMNTGRFFNQVMKGERDVDPFMEITKELGIDPYTRSVSCPQSFGYGGAMGPAQFIPSTWKIMKPALIKATGKSVPNPWDHGDAFMASALYLADLGANRGTAEAERTAACRYNGGGTVCTSRTAGYGTTVLNNAATIQRDIDFLQNL